MWLICRTPEFDRCVKHFQKKRQHELAAMLVNLDTYFQTLQSGVNPQQARHGFAHGETHGAVAIDQRGAPGKPTQTRLYIYPDATTQTLHLITIGDKQSQREDNSTCREYIVSLREQKQDTQDEQDSRPRAKPKLNPPTRESDEDPNDRNSGKDLIQ